VKRLYALGVSVLAFALAAGNATANDGSLQVAGNSIGTVQVGSVNATPATSVNAPVNVNAPVTVAGSSGNSSAGQTTGGAAAATSSSGGSASNQSANHSIGTVQVGSVNAAPATAVNAPVNVNAPVTVAGSSGDSSAGQTTGGAAAATSSSDGSSSNQSACCSIGTVQVGSVNAAAATAINAPANVNAPITVAGSSGNSSAGQTTGGAAAATSSSGGSTSSQSASHSIGTVQIGSVNVTPATAINAPVNVNAPITALDGGCSASCEEPAPCDETERPEASDGAGQPGRYEQPGNADYCDGCGEPTSCDGCGSSQCKEALRLRAYTGFVLHGVVKVKVQVLHVAHLGLEYVAAVKGTAAGTTGIAAGLVVHGAATLRGVVCL
jgi:hypothetical protein